METYLRDFERTLRLDPEETRAIVAEVRGNLEDLVAHLRGQGYGEEEAEREALRRFDDAEGLAHALRRAHRRAPLALQLLAVALVVLGVAGLMLGAYVLVTAVAVGLHSDGQSLSQSGSATFGWLMGLLPQVAQQIGIGGGLTLMLAPGLAILAGGVASLWTAKAVVLGQRRPRWRRVGAGMGLAALCDAALTLAVLGTLPSATARPLAIPQEARLAAAGLCFRPATGQPTRPVVVDRLCADRTATYVQYHIPNPPHYNEPWPTLYDNTAHKLLVPGIPQSLAYYQQHPYQLTRCTPCPIAFGGQYTQDLKDLKRLVPWRSVDEGLAVFTPLNARAHEAVLQFSTVGAAPQIVHLPLNLHNLPRIGGGAHPFIVVSHGGVRVNLIRVVRGLSLSRLSYTVDTTPAVGAIGNMQEMLGPQIHDSVIDAHGQALAPLTHDDTCEGELLRHGGHCAPELTFPPQPAGARLTLIVRGVTIAHFGGYTTITGPWRVPFVMP